MNIISLRNLLLVAFLFHEDNLLNRLKEPTQELANNNVAIAPATNLILLIFITLNILNQYKITEKHI